MLKRRVLNPASLAQLTFCSFIHAVNAATMCPCSLLYSIPLDGYITIYVPILLSLILGLTEKGTSSIPIDVRMYNVNTVL